MSSEQLEELRTEFESMDIDKSGEISMDELEEVSVLDHVSLRFVSRIRFVTVYILGLLFVRS